MTLLDRCRRRGRGRFDQTHARKAALRWLAAWIERKHVFQGMPLLRARFGDSGEHEPELRQIGLLRGEGP